ncbi:hypothetical protein A2671_01600 [Candidatus Kaiserbacteria bacterium RIFCSPHIGHO2_01_FULL_49_13]|uniref:Uncharacterized protein n=1 Tax=Candidatus Kaiserbacteria bacterium RIFCSPHIGHO2_01_FULL_49_13 TaxID=1798477 RepID=A0A1F6CES7_9BACT|nr:MAG: hypothetical protein A2671_01600 [Candidatus Kaiserbacteria bacterium RIFCSPHIGHO2_01_FULL_49_13]
MKYSPAQLRVQLVKIPQDIRDLIGSDELGQKFDAIGKKHQLHVDQLGILGDEMNITLVGLSPAEKFASVISKELSIPMSKAEEITRDMNEQIFQPIRDSLKKIYPASGTTVSSEQKNQTPSSSAHPAREDILREIETISRPTAPKPPSPAQTQPIATLTQPAAPIKTSAPPPNLPGSLEEAKLQGIVNVPREAIQIVPEKPKESFRPPYSEDPYREPPK